MKEQSVIVLLEQYCGRKLYIEGRRCNLNIPDDISVIGFDDNPLSAFSMPPLTTIHLPKKKMAENYISILRSVLMEGRNETCFFSSDPILISRDSVCNFLEKTGGI
ncbi:substrate-binding domain-containing protein [Paucisalibacillus sp. EB02]|uniref:substrate-binding domain-containing protein n=1 Tax=Paucisalibacillus sp. EB02 TaxID=1347087 RepID=UPI0005A7882E|nr:substrate-binding domain-containing protein [Paucisalibacillus sp. EB02]